MENEYLSNAKCDFTFKNVLRNQPVSVCIFLLNKNKYKEHLVRPYLNKILAGKKVVKNPHSKGEEDVSKIEAKINQKYIKNYVEGNLKTNFDFKDQGVIKELI